MPEIRMTRSAAYVSDIEKAQLNQATIQKVRSAIRHRDKLSSIRECILQISLRTASEAQHSTDSLRYLIRAVRLRLALDDMYMSAPLSKHHNPVPAPCTVSKELLMLLRSGSKRNTERMKTRNKGLP